MLERRLVARFQSRRQRQPTRIRRTHDRQGRRHLQGRTAVPRRRPLVPSARKPQLRPRRHRLLVRHRLPRTAHVERRDLQYVRVDGRTPDPADAVLRLRDQPAERPHGACAHQRSRSLRQGSVDRPLVSDGAHTRFHNHGLARVRVRYAGRAPLNGDDSAERRHLAAQTWYRGSQRAVSDRRPRRSRPARCAKCAHGGYPPDRPSAGAVVVGDRVSSRRARERQQAESILTRPAADTYLRVGPFASRAEAERLRYMLAGPDASAHRGLGKPR